MRAFFKAFYQKVTTYRLDFLFKLESSRFFEKIKQKEFITGGIYNPEVNSVRELYDLQQTFLTTTLRKYPWWSKGHLALARAALELNNVATAYASLQAVRIITPTLFANIKVQLLYAQCFTLRGEYSRAQLILQSLPEGDDVIEARFALALATEQFVEAELLIAKLAPARAEALSVATNYVKKRHIHGQASTITKPS